jgi:hypothetical protein
MTMAMAMVAAVLLPPAAAAADEVQQLVDRLEPPARFADHTARFAVGKRTFTRHYAAGRREQTYFVVTDGPRVVAFIPVRGGEIHLLAFRPDAAPKELHLGPDRPHLETAVGARLRTDAYIPGKVGNDESSYHFSAGGEELTLVRRFDGMATFDKWSHHSKQPETVREVNTFTFRCDPVHGYMVSGTFETAVKPAPDKFEYYSAAAEDICNVWAPPTVVSRTVMTPTCQEGFAGWGLNFAAIDLCDRDKSKVTCRDGGFGGYLNEATGWSPVWTIEGAEPKFVVCNAHADLDFVVPWPADAPTDAAGRSRLTIRTRLLALPPELTRHVWERMDVRMAKMRRVMMRIGRVEDFEDQPRPLSCGLRGLTSTGGGPRVTDEHAHSGRRSVVIRGRFWPNLPQVPLKGGARYRLSAWMKLVPDDAEQSDKPEAYITADTYVSSPHHNKWARRMRTTSAGPGDWQKVELTFTAEPWAPFVNIAFVAQGGTAYLDDFELVEVQP